VDICEVDEIIGGGSELLTRLVMAAREGHLCVRGGVEDCIYEELEGDEVWFGKKVGKWGDRFYLQRNWVLESEVVREFKRLLGSDVKRIDRGDLGEMNEMQRVAVEMGLSEGVVFLTGGTGDGKDLYCGEDCGGISGKSVCVCTYREGGGPFEREVRCRGGDAS